MRQNRKNENLFLTKAFKKIKNKLKIVKSDITEELLGTEYIKPILDSIYAAHEAIKSGETSIAKQIIKNNPDYTRHYLGMGETLLLAAIKNKNHEIAEFLLENGANVNARCRITSKITYSCIPEGMENHPHSKANNTPLFYAAENGDEKMVETLLKYKADPNICGEGETSVLHISSVKGHENIVKLLIKHKAEVDKKDKFDNTALFYAVMNQQHKIADILLKSGADKNSTNYMGNNYLHASAQVIDKDLTKKFIDLGVDAASINKKGETPLYILIPDIQSLQPAYFKTQYDISTMLIKSGSGVNDQTYKDGDSAIMRASKYRHYTFLNLFFANGGDVDLETDNADTPLMAISKQSVTRNNKSYENTVDILINNGANVNAQNSIGWSPLHYAVNRRNNGLVKKLIENGANINILTKSNKSPLSIAIETNNFSMVKFLLENEENRANIKHQVQSEQTLIELAKEQHDSSEMVKYLREKTATIRKEDKNNIKKQNDKKQDLQKQRRKDIRALHNKRKPI